MEKGSGGDGVNFLKRVTENLRCDGWFRKLLRLFRKPISEDHPSHFKNVLKEGVNQHIQYVRERAELDRKFEIALFGRPIEYRPDYSIGAKFKEPIVLEDESQ